MASHRARAQFDRARWNLRILAPAWSIQLVLSMGLMGLFSWRFGDTVKDYKNRNLPTMELVWEAAVAGLSLVNCLCTLIEVARYMGESLTPWTMLFTHVIKVTCSAAILGLDIFIYIDQDTPVYTIVGLGVDVVLIITAIILVVYAIITYRRLSAYDDYVFSTSAKSFGYNDGYERHSFNGRPSVDKRGSSFSFMSVRDAHPPPQDVEAGDNDPMPLGHLGRTPSYYDHQRDTQFDAYVARRASWNATSPEHTDQRPEMVDDNGTSRSSTVKSNRSDNSILVTTGDVASNKGEPVMMPRTSSYSSDHVLVSVPEEDDDDDRGRQARADQPMLAQRRDERDSAETIVGHPVTEVDMPEPRWQRE